MIIPKRAKKTPRSSTIRADLAEARRADAKLCRLVKRRRRDDALIARSLMDIKLRGLHLLLGFADLISYAMDRGVADSPRKVRDLLALLGRLENRPLLSAALLAGEVDWTKVRTAASIATPETDAHWLQRVKTLSNRQLEAAVAEERGRAPQLRWGLALTRERQALREQTFADVRRASGRTLTDADVLEILCRTWLDRAAPAEMGSSPRPLIVVHTDERGGQPTMETSTGEVEISHALLETLLCGGALVDLRDPSATPLPSISEENLRFVLARDKRQCRVEGCTRPGAPHVELVAGKSVVVDDPDQVLLLCAVHHQNRHDGLLRITRRGQTLSLRLRDGSAAPAVSPLRPAQTQEAPTTATKEEPTTAQEEPTTAQEEPTTATQPEEPAQERAKQKAKKASNRDDPSRSSRPSSSRAKARIAEPGKVTATRARAPA